MTLQQSAARPDIGAIFHALGDKTRRDLFEQLSSGPRTVSELSAPLDMTLTAVSQHLKVMADCGLIQTNKRGRVRECRLDPGGLIAIERWVSLTRARWEARLDRLGEMLDEEED